MNADVIDLAIVGGGAAGLACAAAAGRLGVSAVVLERMAEPGRKLAITGGRKGNFTHEVGPREMADRFDCDPRWLVPLLRRFPFQRIVGFFHGLNIDSRVDEEGCVWPVRADAAGLRDVLLGEVRRRGGRIRACAGVTGMRQGGQSGQPWRVRLDDGSEVRARRVCIATGGARATRAPGRPATGWAWREAWDSRRWIGSRRWRRSRRATTCASWPASPSRWWRWSS